jgi:hypothetical protein
MNNNNKLYSYAYLTADDILHFKLNIDKVDKDTATTIYDTYSKEAGLPDFSYFIMDASRITEITDPAIGILMKSMEIMKKIKGYLVMVMTEEFLQEIMIRHPEMFNYIAVFHTIDDAKAFIRRSRN